MPHHQRSVAARPTSTSRPRRYLKLDNPVALTLSTPAVSSAGDAYEVSLQGHSEQTRVHATCLLLAQEWEGELDLALGYDSPVTTQATRMRQPPGASCEYLSGRRLSDEQRYVLDRRNLPNRLGNMLKRPGLLLHPEEVGETQSKKEKLQEGSDYNSLSRGGGGMAQACMAPNAILRRRLICNDEPQEANYNWLAMPSKVAVNLKPDAAGKVVIPMEAIHAARGGW